MKRVIIYGTGQAFKSLFSGNDILEWMRINDISIVGVAKTNPDKSGQYVNISDTTYEIKHIGDFAEDLYDYILVTTTKHFEEIRTFLMSQGISEDIVFAIEDFFDKIVNETSKCKYNISIVAIVKDEAEYIEEWLQFHIFMGIEHFYIYDNNSSDDTAKILKEYEKRGLVTYIFWPGICQQIPAYSNAINSFKNDSIYIAFIDVDEFLFSPTGNKIFDELDQIWNQYKESYNPLFEKKPAAIGVNWRRYGTSFYTDRPDDLVIKRFIFRSRDNEGNDITIKSICNPRAVVRMSGAHHAKFLPGFCCISEYGSEIPGPFFRDGRCQRLRINHYVSKSEEEFIKRKRKGDADLDKNFRWQNEEWMKNSLRLYRTKFNEFYDPILVKYCDLVENLIKKFRSEYM